MKQVDRVCHGCPMNCWERPINKNRCGRCFKTNVNVSLYISLVFIGKEGDQTGTDDVPPDCPRFLEHVVLEQNSARV